MNIKLRIALKMDIFINYICIHQYVLNINTNNKNRVHYASFIFYQVHQSRLRSPSLFPKQQCACTISAEHNVLRLKRNILNLIQGTFCQTETRVFFIFLFIYFFHGACRIHILFLSFVNSHFSA